MTHEIIRKARGQIKVIEKGSLGDLTNRLKQLKTSTRKGASGRGGKRYSVIYSIRKAV
jgi:hypothetical protein